MIEKRIAAIGRETLTPLVRDLLGRPDAELTGWTQAPMAYRRILANRQLVRFDGAASVDGGSVPWSLVLKVHGSVDGADPAAGYAAREVQAYRSGLLATLPDGLAAPRLLRLTDDGDGSAWLWLEHVHDRFDNAWPLPQYRVAARHLGRANAAYLTGRPLPSEPWMHLTWAEDHSELAAAVHWLDRVRDLCADPRVSRWVPEGFGERAYAVIRDQPMFLALFPRLPQTLCHHDAARRNLFARLRSDGTEETVAIDWESVGPGALGAEIATLVFGTLRWFSVPVEQAPELEALVLDGYLAGLRDAGWPGDSRLMRLGYMAAVALRWGVIANLLRAAAEDVSRPAAPAQSQPSREEFIEQRTALAAFLLDRADEARDLMSLVR